MAPGHDILGQHAAAGLGKRHKSRRALGRASCEDACQARPRRGAAPRSGSPGAEVARLAAGPFSSSLTPFDAHLPIDGLGHVVDGQAGDGDGGQRLHLDAGLAADAGERGDAQAGQGKDRARCRQLP